VSIPRSAVSLRIIGDSLDPEEITAALQIQPSNATRKGQTVVHEGISGKAPTGVWLFKLQDGQVNEIDDQIRLILSMISGNLETWQHLSERFTTELFVGVFLTSRNQGFEISPSTMKAIIEKKLRIAFDIYYTGSTSDTGGKASEKTARKETVAGTFSELV
jgi:hypothetical protein